ncbi:hypothetical protein B0T20DRAFT_397844 [Sordaria brevicollis]|uniref:Uncharacterized protein n=1 Tax=Sordaria brevicollis TaxID=83679 RepID=A0AAE0U290_SORBR|nr:hypothetical protein B0T20DRAFT_397844 [Sordaria brevicollis]
MQPDHDRMQMIDQLLRRVTAIHVASEVLRNVPWTKANNEDSALIAREARRLNSDIDYVCPRIEVDYLNGQNEEDAWLQAGQRLLDDDLEWLLSRTADCLQHMWKFIRTVFELENMPEAKVLLSSDLSEDLLVEIFGTLVSFFWRSEFDSRKMKNPRCIMLQHLEAPNEMFGEKEGHNTKDHDMISALEDLEWTLWQPDGLIAELNQEHTECPHGEDMDHKRSMLLSDPAMTTLRASLLEKVQDTIYEARVAQIPSVPPTEISHHFQCSDRSFILRKPWFREDPDTSKVLWIHGTPGNKTGVLMKHLAAQKKLTSKSPSIVLSYHFEEAGKLDSERNWDPSVYEPMVKNLLRQLYRYFPTLVDGILVAKSAPSGSEWLTCRWSLRVAESTLFLALEKALEGQDVGHKIYIFLDRPGLPVSKGTECCYGCWHGFREFIYRLSEVERVRVCVANRVEGGFWELEQERDWRRLQRRVRRRHVKAWNGAPAHAVGFRLAAVWRTSVLRCLVFPFNGYDAVVGKGSPATKAVPYPSPDCAEVD